MNPIHLNLVCKLPPNVVIVPFIKEHLTNFTTEQPDVKGHDPEAFKSHILSQAQAGIAISVIQNGKTLGIFGSAKIWNGLEEAWFLVDEVVRRYGISMTKVAKVFISEKFAEDSLNRMQITVRCDDVRAYKWAKCLGFSDDGVMRRFGPDGSDFFMMSIVRED
jgi:RimJ/RimL family protein N-acetyltransferase